MEEAKKGNIIYSEVRLMPNKLYKFSCYYKMGGEGKYEITLINNIVVVAVPTTIWEDIRGLFKRIFTGVAT